MFRRLKKAIEERTTSRMATIVELDSITDSLHDFENETNK